MVLDILEYPDPRLKRVATAVAAVTPEIQKLVRDMAETMYAAPGIGLAAVQVGVLRRMVVIDTVRGEEEPKNPLMLINPEILSLGDTVRLHEEGCLSIPEMYAEVERPALVRVRYVDIEGQQREEDFEDLLATVVQHEIDHMNGVLFIDHLSRLKRDLLVKKFYKAQREKAEQL